MSDKYVKSIYVPIFPQKYLGDPTNIVCRSSWERKIFLWADRSSNIVGWSSEEIKIPYIDPNDKRWHRYYPDLLLKISSGGIVKTFIVEIKPLNQKEKPIPPKKYTPKSKANYVKKCQLWVKNQAKWEAAKVYCKQRGYEFVVLTEVELGINK